MPSSADAGGSTWAAFAAALALGACVAFAAGAQTSIDWQPALAAGEPWRAWSAAWVHYSALHLAANLAGCVLVGLLGIVARLPLRSTGAWIVAWPLTQFGLLLRPDLAHYGGLSGVLHAGVAVAAVHLLASARGTRRAIGLGLLVGVAVKVLLETPWGTALRHPPGWDIAVAPFAHATGLVGGALVSALVEALARRRFTITRDD